MPKVRTTFQPWKEIEVDERDYADLVSQGLVVSPDDSEVSEVGNGEPDETSEAPRNETKEITK